MKLKTFLVVMLLFPISLQADPGIIFTGERNGNTDIYRLDLKTMKIDQISSATSSETQPAVSPDGKTIAFISDRGGADSLYLMNPSDPAAEWVNLSPGMGAYGNPCFSFDGAGVIVRYAPDPELKLSNTQIVEVDIKAKRQRVLLDSVKAFPRGTEDPIVVVDRPLFPDAENLLFTAIQYADLETGRITSSAIHRLDLKSGAISHLAGGESYFDESGMAKGYKATMPKSGGGEISYVAIEGHVNRTPMSMTVAGKEKKVISIQDQNFFGPMLFAGKDWVYGIQDDEGKLGLAVKSVGAKERRTAPFSGQAFEPALIP